MRFGKEERWVKNVIWVVVIAFITTIFGVWGAHIYQMRQHDPVAVVVNGEEVYKDVYGRMLNARLEQYRKVYRKDVTDTDYKKLKKNVIDDIIQDKILFQQAEDYKIDVSSNELNMMFASNDAFRRKDGTIDMSRVEAERKRIPARQLSQWEQRTAVNLKRRKMQNLIVDKVNVLPEEVGMFYAVNKMMPEISHILLKPTKLIDDTSAEEYYKENTDTFVKPLKIRVSRIIITDTDLSNDTPYCIEKIKIENINNKLKRGDSFAVLAESYSDKPYQFKEGELLKGGDIGFITKYSEYSPEFIKTAFDLSLYEISGIIRTKEGFEILQVTDIGDTEYFDFDEVKTNIKWYLLTDTHIDIAKAKAKDIIKKIRDNEISFEDAAVKYSDAVSGESQGYLGKIPRSEISPSYVNYENADIVLKEIPINFSDDKYYVSSNFSDSVLELRKGEVSDIILSKKGIHIVKLHKVYLPGNMDFNIEYKDFEKKYLYLKRNAVFDGWYDYIKNSPETDIDIRVKDPVKEDKSKDNNA